MGFKAKTLLQFKNNYTQRLALNVSGERRYIIGSAHYRGNKCLSIICNNVSLQWRRMPTFATVESAVIVNIKIKK